MKNFINREQLIKAIKAAVITNENLIIVGRPGCGKTEITIEAAKTVTQHTFVGHPAIEDPTVPAGMPVKVTENGKTKVRFLPFKLMESLTTLPEDETAVVILDDFGQAPRSVQAAYMQVIQSHMVGEHKLSPNISFILLTNDKQDQAGVQPLLEPIKSRCLIYHYQLQLEEWIEWAYQNKVYPTIPQYLRWKPEAFSDFRPSTEMRNQPCARTWWKLSKALYAMDKLKADDTLRLMTAEAAVSQYGLEYITFEKLHSKLPDIKKLLAGKATYKHDPSDPSITYALTGSLLQHTTAKTLKAVIKVAKTLPKAFQVSLIHDIKNAKPELIAEDAYLSWAMEHTDLFAL